MPILTKKPHRETASTDLQQGIEACLSVQSPKDWVGEASPPESLEMEKEELGSWLGQQDVGIVYCRRQLCISLRLPMEQSPVEHVALCVS